MKKLNFQNVILKSECFPLIVDKIKSHQAIGTNSKLKTLQFSNNQFTDKELSYINLTFPGQVNNKTVRSVDALRIMQPPITSTPSTPSKNANHLNLPDSPIPVLPLPATNEKALFTPSYHTPIIIQPLSQHSYYSSHYYSSDYSSDAPRIHHTLVNQQTQMNVDQYSADYSSDAPPQSKQSSQKNHKQNPKKYPTPVTSKITSQQNHANSSNKPTPNNFSGQKKVLDYDSYYSSDSKKVITSDLEFLDHYSD